MGCERIAWLIYALGGGWGHLTRAVALARAATAERSVRILTNSPHASHVRNALPQLDLTILDPALSVQVACEQVTHQIESANPRCLMVDTFPRGLGGELVGVRAATKVLIHRDLNPHYVSVASLRRFVASNYDLVLIPGEGEGSAFPGIVTEPWLIRNASELPPPRQPRCILICASGPQDELAWYGEVSNLIARRAPVRCVAPTCPPGCPPECWTAHWPAIDLYPSASVVIGAAGYNTIHECLACNVPLIARPWPRKYDRQWLRARRAARRGQVIIVKEPEQAASAALRMPNENPHHSEFLNGAAQAAILIERETGNEKLETK